MYKRYLRPMLICIGVTFFSANLSAQNEADTNEVRDPTTPLGHSVANVAEEVEQVLELNSVLISKQRKLAIINGVSLREGQKVPGVNGISIQSIQPQKVLLRQGDKVWAINLSPRIRH